MSWPEALLRLQEVDMALKAAHARLAEIAVERKDQTETLAAKKVAEAKASQAQKRQQAQKDLDFELGRAEAKLKQTQERLYSGDVRNPRELQDLQAEMQALKRRKAQLEEELLEAMLAYEAATQEAQAAQALHAVARQRGEARQQALADEQTHIQEQVQGWEAESAKLQALIPPDILDSYHYLQKRLGMALAQIHDGTCSVCGVATQLEIQRKVREKEEVYCDGCGRLLVS